MNSLHWIISQLHHLSDWHRAGWRRSFWLWLSGGVILLQMLLILVYYLTRRLFGHHKFRGTRYDEKLWNELIHLAMEKPPGSTDTGAKARNDASS